MKGRKMKRNKWIVATLLVAVLFGMAPSTDVQAKKSVSLSAKKLTIEKGKSKVLKVKNSKKKVKWKILSGKKYITVKKRTSASVTITGKKKGTAKVQATVGSKKLTCKVIVKKAAKSTDKKTTENTTSTKETSSEKTAEQTKTPSTEPTVSPAVKSAESTPTATPGQSTGEDNSSKTDQTAKPSATSPSSALENPDTEEGVIAYPSEIISSWTVDKNGTDSFSFWGWSEDCSSYSIENLPAGLIAEEKDGYLSVKGTPTMAGATTATLKAIDEVGNTITESIYFIIGSETFITGVGKPDYVLENLENSTYENVSTYAQFVGGSGSYDFTIEDDGGIDAKLKLYDYDGSRAYVRANVKKAGDYTVKVRATDKKDSSISFVASVPIHVEKAITVTGTIKDANGNGMPYDCVEFVNKDKSSRYSQYAYSYSLTDDVKEDDYDGYMAAKKSQQNGVYKARIAAGTYDVTAYYDYSYDQSTDSYYSDTVQNQYKVTFSADTANVDFTLPLYKVTIKAYSDQSYPYLGHKSWSIQKGESLSVWENFDSYDTAWVYLKPGTYTLESDEFGSNSVTTSSYTDESGKTYTSTPSFPSNAWFAGYSYTQTISETYDMCKLTAYVTVGNAAVTVTDATTTVETGKEETYTYKYVYEGLKNAEEKLVEVDKKFDISSELDSKYDIDEDADVTTYTYSYPYKCVFTPEEDGDYEISSGARFYTTDGVEVTTTSSGDYNLEKGTTYIVSSDEGHYSYENITISKCKNLSDLVE